LTGRIDAVTIASVPHPNVPPDLTPLKGGDVLENPVTGERSITLELRAIFGALAPIARRRGNHPKRWLASRR
jgi:hypothetical protein